MEYPKTLAKLKSCAWQPVRIIESYNFAVYTIRNVRGTRETHLQLTRQIYSWHVKLQLHSIFLLVNQDSQQSVRLQQKATSTLKIRPLRHRQYGHIDTDNTATSTPTIRPLRHRQYGHIDTDNTATSTLTIRPHRHWQYEQLIVAFLDKVPPVPKIKNCCPAFYTADCPVSYTYRSQEILQHSDVLAVDKSSYQSQQGQRFFSSPQWEVLLWCSLGLPTRGYHLYNWINQLSNTTIWWLAIYVITLVSTTCFGAYDHLQGDRLTTNL